MFISLFAYTTWGENFIRMVGKAMSEKVIRKVAYNGRNKENWIENRDSLIRTQVPIRSKFVHLEEIGKSGHDMMTDYAASGYTIEEVKFVDIGGVDY